MPAPKLITRAELLTQVAQWGMDVSERTLRFWETAGALPRAVRQSHHGVVQAVYPEWFVLAVAAVHERRRQGQSLPAIAVDMRRVIDGLAFIRWLIDNKVVSLNMVPSGSALIPPLTELARDASGPDNPIKRVTITLADAKGEAAVNLVWFVPDEVLSDGRAISPSPDTPLSDGVRISSPPDSRMAK